MALVDAKSLIAEKAQKHRDEICAWYKSKTQFAPPPFYSSVDLRDSGFKIAPVDANLYPAGFNNICPADLRASSPILTRALKKYGDVKKIVLIPEAHTQNRFYIENLYYLTDMIQNAGFQVRLGWYPELSDGKPIELVSATEKKLTAYPLQIQGGKAVAGDFEGELVLLNNDFSSGYPKRLDEIQTPVLPSLKLGWHTRKKSEHFVHYNRLALEFANLIDIDPFHLCVETEEVPEVNFNEGLGVDQVAERVDAMLSRLQKKYQEMGNPEKPFVFVKSNRGTYGMGIMVVHSAEELRTMNRRAKNKMSMGKGNQPIESVIVQEGIATATVVNRMPAEPVIYLVGCELLGGFLRANTERGTADNLNSQGMVFRKLCMSDLQGLTEPFDEPHPENESTRKPPILELVYGTIGRLSALAAGLEIQDSTISR